MAGVEAVVVAEIVRAEVVVVAVVVVEIEQADLGRSFVVGDLEDVELRDSRLVQSCC